MKFRKKPVVIEAYQFGGDIAWSEKPQWLLSAIMAGKAWCQGGEYPYITIETLEGNHRADVGDWIIQGVKGELYPCKPDIFVMTYEPVSEGEHHGKD